MVVDADGTLVGRGLEEEGADPDVLHAHVLEHGVHLGNRLARVHDVLHDDDAASPEAVGHSDELLDLAGGCGAAVGGELDEGQLALEVDVFHEGGGEHEGAVEHAQEYGGLGAAAEIVVDASGGLTDGRLYLLIGNEKLEILVVKFYPVHDAKVRQKMEK